MPKATVSVDASNWTGGQWNRVLTRRAAVALSVFTFLCCYFREFVSGNVPFLYWGDQLGFASNATRMLSGQLPYRDYFEFLTPGTELVYASLFRLFGVSIWVPNLVMACLAAIAAWLITQCAGRVMQGKFVWLPGLLFSGFVLYGALDATHHWFSTVAVMAAMLLLLDGTTWRRVISGGALCGVTASFTQTKGALVLVGFVCYLAWASRREERRTGSVWRKCLLLCGAALIVFAAINARLIESAGWHRWAWSVIVFPLRYYPSVPLNNWRGTLTDFQIRTGVLKWVCVPFLYVTVPAAYVWSFVMLRVESKERSELKNRLGLIAITGVAMFVAVAPALNIKRVSSVSPPAMILLAWLLAENHRKLAFATNGLAAVSVAIAVAMPIRAQLKHRSFLELPSGRAAITDPAEAEVYRWMMEHTQPGQAYFGMPPMYLPLRLINPTPIEAPGPSEYGRPEQIDAVVAGLETSRPPLLLLRPSMYLPHLYGDSADHLAPFQEYLYRNYRRVKIFSTGDEVWERAGPASIPGEKSAR